MRKGIFILWAVMVFYPVPGFSQNSHEIKAPENRPTSWVYDLEIESKMNMGKMIPKETGEKEQIEKITGQIIFDFLPENKILLSVIDARNPENIQEDWYKDNRSSHILPFGTWTKKWKTQRDKIKGKGEVGLSSYPDAIVELKCRLEKLTPENANLECQRIMKTEGKNAITATMGSDIEMKVSYNRKLQKFDKMTTIEKTSLGPMGGANSQDEVTK